MATVEMEGQVRLGSGKLRVMRASRSRSVSQDLSLERFHSQELIQEQQEGHKHLMQFNAQVCMCCLVCILQEGTRLLTKKRVSVTQVVSQPYALLNSGKRDPLDRPG